MHYHIASLIAPLNLIQVATKMSSGPTKEEILLTVVLAPYSVELILSFLTNNLAFYTVSTSSNAPNHGNKIVPSHF